MKCPMKLIWRRFRGRPKKTGRAYPTKPPPVSAVSYFNRRTSHRCRSRVGRGALQVKGDTPFPPKDTERCSYGHREYHQRQVQDLTMLRQGDRRWG